MPMLHTKFGAVFFRRDSDGHVSFTRDGIELEDADILALIDVHIRQGGLERASSRKRDEVATPRALMRTPAQLHADFRRDAPARIPLQYLLSPGYFATRGRPTEPVEQQSPRAEATG